MKIALLIPSTSNGRDEWSAAKDTYLYAHTLRTFGTTYDREHTYCVYVGIDRGDRGQRHDRRQRYDGRHGHQRHQRRAGGDLCLLQRRRLQRHRPLFHGPVGLGVLADG